MNLELLLSILLAIAHYGTVTPATHRQMLCAACRVVVYEIEYEIAKVDPRKKLDVEGFRVDPSGKTLSKKINYARSETHLTEITEKLCDIANEYAKAVNGETGEVSYVVTKSRDGTPLKLQNVTFQQGDQERLKHDCNAVIENNEENLIRFFKVPRKNPKEFCSTVADLCDEEDEENYGKDEL